jgi:NAD-dependent DNA ligase
MSNKVNEKTKKELKDKIIKIDGFAELTAGRFIDNFEKFKKFYEDFNEVYDISHMIKIVHKKNTKQLRFKDDVIVFTGVRDDELQKEIEDMGGKVTGSVSKNTTILITSDNPDTGTEKYKKAKTLGIKIYTISEFRNKK